MEQRAEQAERELNKLKLINYLRERIGMEMDALVTGVEPFGLFAQGIELPASGFIPVDSLPGDRYFFDRGTRTLQGYRAGNRFRLGDSLRIKVVSADPDRRELQYALVPGKRGTSNRKPSDHQRPASGGRGRPARQQSGRPATSPPDRKGQRPKKHR